MSTVVAPYMLKKSQVVPCEYLFLILAHRKVNQLFARKSVDGRTSPSSSQLHHPFRPYLLTVLEEQPRNRR